MEYMERMKGFEPSTFCMASRRSSQLSYIRPLHPRPLAVRALPAETDYSRSSPTVQPPVRRLSRHIPCGSPATEARSGEPAVMGSRSDRRVPG